MILDYHHDRLFPGSTVTTRFGWDLDPPGPRIHHAVDRAGRGEVCLPVSANGVAFIPNDPRDPASSTVLRAIGNGYEFRALHFYYNELSPACREAIERGTPLEWGERIGPPGNVGLSVSKHGGDGRHIHYTLILKPQVYDDMLDDLYPTWRNDETAQYKKPYGAKFQKEFAARRIAWMNRVVVARLDPYWQDIRYYVDADALFGKKA